MMSHFHVKNNFRNMIIYNNIRYNIYKYKSELYGDALWCVAELHLIETKCVFTYDKCVSDVFMCFYVYLCV